MIIRIRKRLLRDIAADVVAVIGGLCIVYALYLIWLPLAYLATGAGLLLVAVLIAPRKEAE